MQTPELLKIVTDEIDERKGQHVTVLDVQGKTSICDFMIVVTATSARHAKSLCDYIIEKVKAHDLLPLGFEGQQSDWMLLDLGDIIIHVMTAQSREFYQLEKLWSVDNAKSTTP